MPRRFCTSFKYCSLIISFVVVHIRLLRPVCQKTWSSDFPSLSTRQRSEYTAEKKLSWVEEWEAAATVCTAEDNGAMGHFCLLFLTWCSPVTFQQFLSSSSRWQAYKFCPFNNSLDLVQFLSKTHSTDTSCQYVIIS